MSVRESEPPTVKIQRLAGLTPSVAAQLCLIFALCSALYALNLSRHPHPDELYHLLAARGLLETGEPRIAEGVYMRALAYTKLVAASMHAFGDTLVAARLPSVAAMALTVCLLFAWVRTAAGSTAAWIAAVLFATSPFAVEIAQFARFYALQNLCFLVFAICVYRLFEPPVVSPSLCVTLGVVGLCSLAVASYLQPTTMIGVIGVGLWALIGGRDTIGRVLSPLWNHHRTAVMITATLLVCVGLYVLFGAGLFARLLEEYRTVPLFNASRSNSFWYYHLIYLAYYPSVWPAIGFIALASVMYRPRIGLFCIIVFATSFLLASFAAPKSARYMIFAQPFFFALIGVGVAPFVSRVASWTTRGAARLSAEIGVGIRFSRASTILLIVPVLLVFLVGNAFSIRSASLLGDFRLPIDPPVIDWEVSAESVRALMGEADVVVTQAELEMLYHFDDYDVLVSASRLGENAGAVDFDADFRTGRPIIGTEQGMRRLFACYDRGVFVTNESRWGNKNLISEEIMEVVERETDPVELDHSSGVLAFVWNRSEDTGAKPTQCTGLPDFTE